ncbi:hypothetical protein AVEN_79305-1 [Araneus ventricosus]|uniref:Uncharacterized protein n=1 Tax=Araneus ventricosus TaxID=182803 RepID=A0A4Y2TLW6_ARAVE|nr:hypothetical protein AVEN_79305-1 [Araneus ventricosus]
MLTKFDITGRLMFGAEFLMTGSLWTSILRGNVNGTMILGTPAGCNNRLCGESIVVPTPKCIVQYDGVLPHKISNIKQYLMETFQNQFIGYDGFVEWPPHSTDLTPLDLFLWGHIKGQVYATPPSTLQDLRRRITDACASATPAMLHDVQREIQSRVQMCMVDNREHFEQYK